uniref:Neurotransmitter-gated ion-channel transmembrane domain-containing protein n=1 Tax=Xiphophorus couchianus TaxID=32473 RepID=A0A3B5LCY8_9TELE
GSAFCSSDAYTDEDLMLYWKSGDDETWWWQQHGLGLFIRTFTKQLGCIVSCFSGWYNRLYINFTLRRHIFFFLLQTYFPATLMVMLSWVSFWIDRRAVPARVSLGITTVLTMSTIITGVNASMPRVSYIKAVDIYLWVSFVFVFLSVLEYAAVNYLTTVRDGKDRKLREKLKEQFQKIPRLSHDFLPFFLSSFLSITQSQTLPCTCETKKKGIRSFRIIQNTHTIDTYSRMIFPGAYILFNLIYWCVYC